PVRFHLPAHGVQHLLAVHSRGWRAERLLRAGDPHGEEGRRGRRATHLHPRLQPVEPRGLRPPAQRRRGRRQRRRLTPTSRERSPSRLLNRFTPQRRAFANGGGAGQRRGGGAGGGGACWPSTMSSAGPATGPRRVLTATPSAATGVSSPGASE